MACISKLLTYRYDSIKLRIRHRIGGFVGAKETPIVFDQSIDTKKP
jgi:hypothetical protein